MKAATPLRRRHSIANGAIGQLCYLTVRSLIAPAHVVFLEVRSNALSGLSYGPLQLKHIVGYPRSEHPRILLIKSTRKLVAQPAVQQAATTTAQPQQFMLVPVQAQQQAPAPEVVREVVKHKTIVHHKYVQHAEPVQHAQYAQYSQPEPTPYNAPAPVYQQTSANSVSPLGMGVGAVVGGLVGSRVGGGNGRTLATIAGAVGGGYLGNEVAKRYP
jgi:hypothetical protein